MQLLSLPSVSLPGLVLSRLLHRLFPVREVQRSRTVPGTASDIMVSVIGAVTVWVVERLSSDILIVFLPSLPWH